MSSKELTWNFHKIMSDCSDNSQRLREFSRTLASKLCTHDLSLDSRAELTSEYELLSLLSMLYDFETEPLASQFPHENLSLQSQLSNLYKSNKEFRLFLTLLHWTETIKRVDASKFIDSTLIPDAQLSTSSRPASLDPDSLAKSQSQYKSSFNKVMIDCFWLIRAGKLKKAQELLQSLGAGWLALTLGGLCPYFNSQFYKALNDPMNVSCFHTVDSSLPQEKFYENFEYGNANIELYMKSCWALSKSQSASVAEKAVFGSFCGNLEAVTEMCESNVHDYFWALVRSVFLFKFRYFVQGFEENFKIVEESNDSVFDMPEKIPDHYPGSLENILQRVQKRFSDEFSQTIVSVQFMLIAAALKDNKNEYIEKLLSPKVPKYCLRAIVHSFVCMKNLFGQIHPRLYSRFDELLIAYLSYISEDYVEIEIVVFYLRYLSFNENLYLDFFVHLFTRYNDEQSHRKIVETLNNYARDSVHIILCQAALSQIDFSFFLINFESLVQAIEQKQVTEGFSERLIRNIPAPVSKQSLPYILSAVRKLALAGKIKLGQILVSKTFSTEKDSTQDFELRYWGNFFLSIEAYGSFYKTKHEDYNVFINRGQTSEYFHSLQKLDNNPTLIMERYNEKCKQMADELKSKVEEITGVHYGAFPLGGNVQEIQNFREKWWSVLIMVLAEIYAQLDRVDELEKLKEVLECLWAGKMVEDQWNKVMRKLLEKLGR